MTFLHALDRIVPFAIFGAALVTSVCRRATAPNPTPSAPKVTADEAKRP